MQNNSYPRKLKKYSNKFINFSSNDYLGLSTHSLLIERSAAFANQYGAGSASSRLVTGNYAIYETIEKKLAASLKKPAALIFGSGFQANTSILSALLDPSILGEEPLVFCDKFCHASMLIGANSFIRFKHNDYDHLKLLLEKYENSPRPKFILVESIYSMEGDAADLPKIIKLAKLHHAFLYVDDAHAVGVYGWGKAVEFADDIDVIMGTFSKALGSFGAYVGCSESLRDYLINKCKGLIYSTALPPAVWGAISAAIDLMPALQLERELLIKNTENLRNYFIEEGFNLGNSTTHIIPWIIGDAEKTLKISDHLEQQGIIAAAIRPPSVPYGKSRIRFCVTARHTEDEFEKLMSVMNKMRIFYASPLSHDVLRHGRGVGGEGLDV